jgi:hypothetical protein
MEQPISGPIDIDRVAGIKARLTDLRNDLQKLTCLNTAHLQGRLIDLIARARESLFRGEASEDFPMKTNSALGKNVRIAGTATSFQGRYVSLPGGLTRGLRVACAEADTGSWFGLELDADGRVAHKVSDIYLFIKLFSEYPFELWPVAFFTQGQETRRLDLKCMYFDRNTQYAMIAENISNLYADASDESACLRLGCYFPTNRQFAATILDVKFLCTV